MTLHVSSRLVFRLVVFAATLLRLFTPAAAQSAAGLPATPGLAERLERLAAEIDRHRVDLRVPGAVLAIVRGEDVIFARGFGVADVEKKTPVTPNTAFFIGSATKAFTATLVGMLVDEGRMRWDDPISTTPNAITGISTACNHFAHFSTITDNKPTLDQAARQIGDWLR